MMSLWHIPEWHCLTLPSTFLRDKQRQVKSKHVFLHPSTPKSCSAEVFTIAALMVSSVSASDVLTCVFSICQVINVSFSQIGLWSVAAAGQKEVTVRAALLSQRLSQAFEFWPVLVPLTLSVFLGWFLFISKTLFFLLVTFILNCKFHLLVFFWKTVRGLMFSDFLGSPSLGDIIRWAFWDDLRAPQSLHLKGTHVSVKI